MKLFLDHNQRLFLQGEKMEGVEEFLKKCNESGDAAYTALRSVLEKLENPSTRVDARRFLTNLRKHLDSAGVSLDDCFSSYHFRINDIQLEHSFPGFQKRKKLTMLVIPSIFMPEDWSFTFYEGLNRQPESIFKDKIVAELGCGNGWITIAIAEKWSPSKVYGLDINPRAVKVSWLNLYLNALDDDGQPIYDDEKKTLLDRVEFYESDLLAYCKDHDIMLETIVGCIPQILNPNPDAMTKMITETASEEFLHSLSNYCALQGFVEDQFGLGLIARAVEEGVTIIKPTGIMIFNMGGRPGEAVCRRLFERRGLHVKKIWQTKVVQAADTDISALVEIEKNSPHRFEFFKGITGDQPLCARTAWAYKKAGGCISHSISVYSCELYQPSQVKMIFEFLRDGSEEINNSLDLSFDNAAVADEKILFLSYLASVLKETLYLPFESPAGSRRFRDLVTRFIKTYHHIPITSKNVVVFPSRTEAIENALRLFSPNLAIVDENLTRHLPRKWMTSLEIEKREISEASEDVVTVIEAPRQSDLMIELVKKLKPQVVVTGIADFESVTSAAFENLLTVTREIGSRLFVDISDHFELSSLPSSNGVLKYLAGNSLPSHASVICGLLMNQVYADLEVAFMISEDETILQAMAKTIELLQGTTPLISQYYYGCLFHELLSFQLADRHPPAMRDGGTENASKLIGFASSAVSAFSNSELSISEGNNESTLIHMDVDQSLLPIPSPVKAAIFESFARQNLSESETDVTSSIKQFMTTKYGFPTYNTKFLYADYSLSLFNKLLHCCIQEGGTFCFPDGCNGNYVAAAKFMKADIVKVSTQVDSGFKLTADVLNNALVSVKSPWVYISGPTINPTGLLYSNKEIEDILSVCAKFGARVLIDTSFSGLEYDFDNLDAWNIEHSLTKVNSSVHSTFCVSLFGSLSLEMLTGGGLSFAFLAIDRSLFFETDNVFIGLKKPHSTTRYAMKKLLALVEQGGQLSAYVSEHKRILKHRSQRLRETLQKCGWEVIPSLGGVSMVARPCGYVGKHVTYKNSDLHKIELVDESAIREAILATTNLCINSSSWTGIPGYCRFTIALQDNEFEQALGCIEKFNDLVV